jgi:hypothetical protein
MGDADPRGCGIPESASHDSRGLTYMSAPALPTPDTADTATENIFAENPS